MCSFERRLFVLLFGLEYHRLVSSSFLVCPSGVGIFFSKRRAPALCPHGTARSRRSGCSSGRCSPQRSAEEGESSLASSHFLWRPLEKMSSKLFVTSSQKNGREATRNSIMLGEPTILGNFKCSSHQRRAFCILRIPVHFSLSSCARTEYVDALTHLASDEPTKSVHFLGH